MTESRADLAAPAAVVVCLMLAAGPAAPQDHSAVIEDNETAAIADARTIISAEAAYQTVNGGFYDSPQCLFKPSACIPGYPAQGPTFLDWAIASLMVKDGYGRGIFTKPPAQKPGAEVSPSSALSYAVILWPDKPGKTGRRVFCADADGVICFTEDGSRPIVQPDVRCPWEAKDGKPAGCEVLH
jgi:hypothetical protein